MGLGLGTSKRYERYDHDDENLPAARVEDGIRRLHCSHAKVGNLQMLLVLVQQDVFRLKVAMTILC